MQFQNIYLPKDIRNICMIRKKIFVAVLVASLVLMVVASVNPVVGEEDHPIQNYQDFAEFIQEENIDTNKTYHAEMELHETPFQDEKNGRVEITGNNMDWLRLAYEVMKSQ